MARVASAPFSSGIDRSISTTSGCASRASWTASRPSPTHATTSMSASASTKCLSPSATTPWSSAIKMRIGMVRPLPLQRHPGVDARALAGTGSDVQLPAGGFRALAHRRHPPAAAARARQLETLPVVLHVEDQLLVGGRNLEADVGRLRVLEHVVERFLRDAEQRDRGLRARVLRFGGVAVG